MSRHSEKSGDDSLFVFPRGWLARFRPALMAWYDQQARPLPWRESRDPYAIWVSEVMLQQTTVAAVVPYFERFLQRFPTVADLAEAQEEDVLRLWEGLGYYSRARNLQKAARQIVAAEADGGFAGEFPATPEEWQKLPGIGRYTAGAIVGFAFDTPAPIVEANTQRLYARLMGYEGELTTTAGRRLLWNFAEQLVPDHQPGRFNQALMDLGSLVCRPVAPACGKCPVAICCRAAAEGRQADIPKLTKRPEPTDLTEFAIVIVRDGCCLLMRWNHGERWAGLWDFVRFGTDHLTTGTAEVPTSLELAEAVRKIVGETVTVGDCFHELTHAVTRYRIRLRAHRAVPPERPARRRKSDRQQTTPAGSDTGTVPVRETAWVPFDQLADYPLSVSARKIARIVTERTSGLFRDDWLSDSP